MKRRRKIKAFACWLPLIAVAYFCVGISGCEVHVPGLSSITPNTGDQGTDVPITITGNNFEFGGVPFVGRRPVIRIDGGQNKGVSTTFDSRCESPYLQCDPYTDTTINLTLHIDANATAGHHTIAVVTVDRVNAYLQPLVSPWQSFYVRCTGCPPPPQLWNLVTQPENTPLVPGGRVTFRFIGKNFFNNNPQVQIDGDGVTPDPAPPVVQQSGDLDYFDLAISAASYATAGLHNVTVTTPGGVSNPLQLTVDASSLRPTPSPGSTPYLGKITPSHVVKANCFGCDGWVQFKCEGNGFGTTPEVIIDNPSLSPVTIWRDHADQDKVAIAIMVLPSDFPERFVNVQVRNNTATSNSLPLIIDTKGDDEPFVIGTFDGVRRGQEGDFTVYGRNLDGAIEQPSSGIAGVKLTNIQSDCCHISFHAKADLTAPVTGDDATNLTIMTAGGETNAFSFLIYH